jgi:hypothetical protein
MTTGKYYKTQHQRSLGIYYASLFLFYGLLIAILCVNLMAWPIVLGEFIYALLSQVIVYYNAAVKLKCTKMMWGLPLLDVLYVLYLLVYGTKGLFTKNTRQW